MPAASRADAPPPLAVPPDASNASRRERCGARRGSARRDASGGPTIVKSARLIFDADGLRDRAFALERRRRARSLASAVRRSACSRRSHRTRTFLRWRSISSRARARPAAGRRRARDRALRATTSRRARAAAASSSAASSPIVVDRQRRSNARLRFRPDPPQPPDRQAARETRLLLRLRIARSPLGLHESEAIFAIIFPVATPPLTVRRVASKTRRRIAAAKIAAPLRATRAEVDEGFVHR